MKMGELKYLSDGTLEELEKKVVIGNLRLKWLKKDRKSVV